MLKHLIPLLLLSLALSNVQLSKDILKVYDIYEEMMDKLNIHDEVHLKQCMITKTNFLSLLEKSTQLLQNINDNKYNFGSVVFNLNMMLLDLKQIYYGCVAGTQKKLLEKFNSLFYQIPANFIKICRNFKKVMNADKDAVIGFEHMKEIMTTGIYSLDDPASFEDFEVFEKCFSGVFNIRDTVTDVANKSANFFNGKELFRKVLYAYTLLFENQSDLSSGCGELWKKITS
jgi:hypothetical protein